jgi:hypothetical protein
MVMIDRGLDIAGCTYASRRPRLTTYCYDLIDMLITVKISLRHPAACLLPTYEIKNYGNKPRPREPPRLDPS